MLHSVSTTGGSSNSHLVRGVPKIFTRIARKSSNPFLEFIHMARAGGYLILVVEKWEWVSGRAGGAQLRQGGRRLLAQPRQRQLRLVQPRRPARTRLKSTLAPDKTGPVLRRNEFNFYVGLENFTLYKTSAALKTKSMLIRLEDIIAAHILYLVWRGGGGV
jgi:hypothetical protein